MVLALELNCLRAGKAPRILEGASSLEQQASNDVERQRPFDDFKREVQQLLETSQCPTDPARRLMVCWDRLAKQNINPVDKWYRSASEETSEDGPAFQVRKKLVEQRSKGFRRKPLGRTDSCSDRPQLDVCVVSRTGLYTDCLNGSDGLERGKYGRGCFDPKKHHSKLA
jgi:hypothetical protein